MAWTIAVILGIGFISSILVFLLKSFDKSKQAMKVFLFMLTLASLILLAQATNIIVDSKAGASLAPNLNLLSTSFLVITITSFSIFMMYFLVIYTRGIIIGMRDARKEKITNEFGDL